MTRIAFAAKQERVYQHGRRRMRTSFPSIKRPVLFDPPPDAQEGMGKAVFYLADAILFHLHNGVKRVISHRTIHSAFGDGIPRSAACGGRASFVVNGLQKKELCKNFRAKPLASAAPVNGQ